jgi:hypothetical protein
VRLTTHPLLVPWSRKGRAIPLLPLWAIRPVQTLSIPIALLPLWAVRPVKSLSIAIPLLPVWAVRPVQSLSRAIPLLPLWAVRSVQSLSIAIPLLPLWTVRPVQSLSACTRVHITFLPITNVKLFNTFFIRRKGKYFYINTRNYRCPPPKKIKRFSCTSF